MPFLAKSSKSLILMPCLIGPNVRTTFSAPNALLLLDNMLPLVPKSRAMPIDTNFVNFIFTARLKLFFRDLYIFVHYRCSSYILQGRPCNLCPRHTHNLDRDFFSILTLKISYHICKNLFASIPSAFYLLHLHPSISECLPPST